MPDTGNTQKRFLELATEEQSFRKQIVRGLIQVLKNPRISPALRFLIVSALLTALCLSVIVFIFLVCAIHSSFTKSDLDPQFFIIAILVLFVLFMILAISLTFKASTTEQWLRLDDNFDRIYKARFGG